MKHTLKLLLIASVLTLPTVFGAADHFPESTGQTTTKLQNLSIVELSNRAFALRNRPAGVERLYLKSLDHPDTLWFHVRFTAATLEKLGSLDSAIQAYKRSKTLPKTQIYSDIATAEIVRLKQLPSQRPKSTLHLLPDDLVMSITGLTTNNDRIDLGFLSANDLSALMLVSTGWHDIIQPLFNIANAWRHTDVVPRLLQDAHHPLDAVMLPFFAANNHTLFETLLDLILGSRFSINPHMSVDEQTDLVRNIDNNTTFTYVQKSILKGLLPNATLDNIRWVADTLETTREYRKKAAKFYERVAIHPNATSDDILWATKRILFIGYAFFDRAVKLLEHLASHLDATPSDINNAVDILVYLAGLLSIYSDKHAVYLHRAVELLELSAAKAATSNDLYQVAYKFIYVGSNHPFGSEERAKLFEKAAAFYELSANHREATPEDIRDAADGLREIGST